MKRIFEGILLFVFFFVWIILFWCSTFTALLGNCLEKITGVTLLIVLFIIMGFSVYKKDYKKICK